ncbi:type IV secretory system conjugative DNA transfer family protein [Halolamina rubra]|uniref:type IV secretory system conjugative DNA transfer family protein n=1 Tax=Halolamina rubra TaxID=1380430 RepID=UPI00067929D9|nr:ATP-binding protein [Halolamina rubra]
MFPDGFTTERSYLRVHPSDEPLQPDRIAQSLTRLHRTDAATEPPTHEWLFAATGEPGPDGDRRIEWYVGTDGQLGPVRRTLRQVLPDSVDLVETDCTYRELLDLPADPDVATAPSAADPGDTVADGAGTDAVDATAGASDTETADTPHWDVAAVEWEGVGDRPADWQCPLPSLAEFAVDDDPNANTDTAGNWPLADLLDGLATSDAPTLVQFLLTPRADWTARKADRILDLELHSDLRRNAVLQSLLGSPERPAEPDPPDATDDPDSPDESVNPANRQRIEGLRTVDARQSFTLNARAITVDTDADRATRTSEAVAAGLQAIRGDHYRVTPTVADYGTDAAHDRLADLCTRTTTQSPTRWRHQLPGTTNASPAIVADPGAVAACCLVNGPALGPAASRAVEPTPADRTGIELPPRTVLDRYLDQAGMTVGHPKTGDRERLDATLSLPPSIQPLHTTLFGATGSGKTAVGQTMQLTNHAATDGATVYLDAKGDNAPAEYARMQFARHGDLDNLHYFDCTEYLPALPFLTIEPLLEAGLDREWAVNTVAEHYVDLLAAAMGPEQFYSAEAAVEVLEQLVRALFDPVHGAASISQQELLAAAAQFHETGNPPPVSDGALHQKLANTAANAPTTFDSIMSAVTRRIGLATNDARLAPLFEAQPDAATFDLRAALDEDCVIVFDLQGYGDRSRTLLAVAILSQLWRALQRRHALAPDRDHPLVNCYIEEAAELATTGVLDTLLAQGRSFNLALTLAMQFPEQLRESHPRVYAELLNDVGTIITGPVGVDRRLAERLASSDADAEAVADRLRDLQRGEWLVRPAAPFATRQPRPFAVASPSLPEGHPESDRSLTGARDQAFDDAFAAAKTRTREQRGVAVGRTASGSTDPAALDGPVTGSVAGLTAATATIPHSERFPDGLTYLDEPPYPLVCETCETRYAATPEGMRRAIACHGSLDAVDRANIPICSLDLQLTSGERAASPYSDAQLRLLAAVYMAHQQRFDPTLEYDLVWDSMTQLEAYVGIDTDGAQELLDDGLLRIDCRRPHKLYTVTPDGRDAIGVGHREGIAYGDGTGDLSESSLHVAMVAVGARLLDQEFVAPADQPGTRVERYYGVDDGRLDAAVLDADGDVVAALEAERINNDRGEAIPSDFDKMAACDPEAAWWLVKTRGDGHQVLRALHDPPDGDSRVPRSYSENMAPREYRLDTPGLTDVLTLEYARDTLLDGDGPLA